MFLFKFCPNLLDFDEIKYISSLNLNRIRPDETKLLYAHGQTYKETCWRW
jgi:hypothetical protein